MQRADRLNDVTVDQVFEPVRQPAPHAADAAAAATGPAGPPALSLAGLTKSYGPVRAVAGVDLRVDRGEMVAILGRNGAVKSTITEMITGLVKPDTGSVEIFGLDPQTAVAAGTVGAMLQAGALLHDATTRQLLELMHGLHRHPLPLAEIIQTAEVGDFLRTKTDKLSGGQAQRLRFALAIMADPQLLILDEPTVGMDVEIRRAFWESMRRFAAGGRTVLFATHYLDEADQMADRIVVLDRGRVVADGTGADIKALIGGRTIAFLAEHRDERSFADLPDVLQVQRLGSRILLRSQDSDRTLRALLDRDRDVREIEITSVSLEDAFVALTDIDSAVSATGDTADHDHSGSIR
jgi:ABC-2 type transport system ATP-binding protein